MRWLAYAGSFQKFLPRVHSAQSYQVSCPFRSAHESWNSLSSLAELVAPEARSRAAFLAECREGKFEGVVATYRTFASVEITGVFDAELVQLLPESLKFICHNGECVVCVSLVGWVVCCCDLICRLRAVPAVGGVSI
jgi:hypothetical protein